MNDRVVADPNGQIRKTELSADFKDWYDATYGRGAPNIKEVQAYMDKKYKKMDRGKVWLGARISRDSEMYDAHIDETDVAGIGGF
jgi:disulfide oxidoreductase YuzD